MTGSPSLPLATEASSTGQLELTVVMPCLNEELTVGACVRKAVATIRELGLAGEVVVSDNGSTDRSVEIATAEGARVVQCLTKGYGNALRYGFAQARGRYILMGDSDDSYDFTDLGRFVERLRAGADLVMGNRMKGGIRPGAMPWHHRWIGNPGLTWFLNLLFRTGVGDTHCGMRAFTKQAVEKMDLRMPGMEMASEMVIKASQAGLRIEEIPIVLYPDGRNRPPHLRSWRDGWRHLRFMLMCCPSFLFILPGMLLTLFGLLAPPVALLSGYGDYTNVFGPNFLFTSAMLGVVGCNLMFFGVLAKLVTQHFDPVFTDARLNGWMQCFTLERGIWTGLLLTLAGIVVGTPTLFEYLSVGTVTQPAWWILALTLGTLGIETLFGAFLIGVVQLPREASKLG